MKIVYFLGVLLLPCIASRVLLHPHKNLYYYGYKNPLMRQQQHQLSGRQNGFAQNILSFFLQQAIAPIQGELSRMTQENHKMTLIADAQKIIHERQMAKMNQDLQSSMESATEAQEMASQAMKRAEEAMEELHQAHEDMEILKTTVRELQASVTESPPVDVNPPDESPDQTDPPETASPSPSPDRTTSTTPTPEGTTSSSLDSPEDTATTELTPEDMSFMGGSTIPPEETEETTVSPEDTTDIPTLRLNGLALDSSSILNADIKYLKLLQQHLNSFLSQQKFKMS